MEFAIAITILIFGVLALLFVVDIYRYRQPLTEEEISVLVTKRVRKAALSGLAFDTTPVIANVAEKAAMNALGEFIEFNIEYKSVPARIAGLLKYKKHEWIVLVFIKDGIASRSWWNKGFDGNSVSLFLSDKALKEQIRRSLPDTILVLHNHPNSAPNRYLNNKPSQADLKSAISFHKELNEKGISLLEFICERGIPYLYYAGLVLSPFSERRSINQIEAVNGKSIFKNRTLRKELRAETWADKIYGATLSNSKSTFRSDQKLRQSSFDFYLKHYEGIASPCFEKTCIEIYLRSSRAQRAITGSYIGKAIPSSQLYTHYATDWHKFLSEDESSNERKYKDNERNYKEIMEGAGHIIHHAQLFRNDSSARLKGTASKYSHGREKFNLNYHSTLR